MTSSHSEQRDVHWENWNGSLSATAEVGFYPETTSDLIQIVRRAKAEGKKIRVAGKGHTLSPLVPTSEFLVFIYKMKKIEVDRSNPDNLRVIVEPGAQVSDLDAVFREHGLAFPSNVVPTDVQLGGIVTPGAHGSGRTQPPVDGYVESMEIVTASGELRTFSEAKDGPEMMNAVRLNLGLFGIISRITFRVVPTFFVRVVDSKPLVLDTINNIQSIVESHDFVDISWYPFNEQLWMKTLDKVPAPSPGQSSMRMAHKPVVFQANQDGGVITNLVIDLMLKYPEITPAVCQAMLASNPVQDVVQDITTALHYQTTSPIMQRLHDTSFGFSAGPGFENVKRSFFFVLNRVNELAKDGKYPLNLGMELRFLRGSPNLLSFIGNDGPTCVMEMATFRGTEGWAEFRNEVSYEWMRTVGARPTWAKEFQDIPGINEHIRSAYGENFERFKHIRDALDPQRMFMNSFLERLFYPSR